MVWADWAASWLIEPSAAATSYCYLLVSPIGRSARLTTVSTSQHKSFESSGLNMIEQEMMYETTWNNYECQEYPTTEYLGILRQWTFIWFVWAHMSHANRPHPKGNLTNPAKQAAAKCPIDSRTIHLAEKDWAGSTMSTRIHIDWAVSSSESAPLWGKEPINDALIQSRASRVDTQLNSFLFFQVVGCWKCMVLYSSIRVDAHSLLLLPNILIKTKKRWSYFSGSNGIT